MFTSSWATDTCGDGDGVVVGDTVTDVETDGVMDGDADGVGVGETDGEVVAEEEGDGDGVEVTEGDGDGVTDTGTQHRSTAPLISSWVGWYKEKGK